MKKLIKESELPVELSAKLSVQSAYSKELTNVENALKKGLSCLVEVDKEVSSIFYTCLRDAFKSNKSGKTCIYLDGRPRADDTEGAQSNAIMILLQQIRDVVRGSADDKIIILPHLDLLVTSNGTLTSEAKEVIFLMYENPNIVWVGFKDHSLSLPQSITNLFPHRESIIGVSRDRLQYLVTGRESRKFGKDFDPIKLYKYVSGINAFKLRKLLISLDSEDYPTNPDYAYKQLRTSTLTGQLVVPEINLQKDIGGYNDIKQQIQTEILDILARKDNSSEEEAKMIESLIPKGMIFWGPPGTGKTLFAKAIATALNAACIVVSGPELKSKWVGESEENLRRIFTQARKSAPAVIVFDEIDSFAHSRGAYSGSGVEHSMVNQLLTEMDGFRKDELVFVIGTTNFVESLDQALLRPGRFECHLNVPYPGKEDRKEIIEIYNSKMNLQMSSEVIDYAVTMTGNLTPDTQTKYSGDHLNAFARQLARTHIRNNRKDETTKSDVDDALAGKAKKLTFTNLEESTIATHEAGHAIVAMNCKHVPSIEKISIGGDIPGALGFVQYAQRTHKYVITKNQILDMICTLLGGRQSEQLFLDDISIGSQGDITQATMMARSLIEEYGLGSGDNLEGVSLNSKDVQRSEEMKTTVENAVGKIISEQKLRATQILEANKKTTKLLIDTLIEKKTIDAETFKKMMEKKSGKSNSKTNY